MVKLKMNPLRNLHLQKGKMRREGTMKFPPGDGDEDITRPDTTTTTTTSSTLHKEIRGQQREIIRC